MSYITIRRLSSSAVTKVKTTPSKAHQHQPIPDALFPRGFLATGLHSGVKKPKSLNLNPLSSAPKDLALIVSTTPANQTSAAACFTRNVFKAAPVQVSNTVLKATNGRARRVVVNSGCANAVTGTKGIEDAWAMARATDDAFSDRAVASVAPKSDSAETLVMSTGVIGQLLPIGNILQGIASGATSMKLHPSESSESSGQLHSGFADWERAAEAFMTTDTFPKLRATSFKLPFPSSSQPLTVRMAGIDKGAGMIHPNMGPPHATLLGLIVTDAPVNPKSLQSALSYAIDRSFNSISVDGDMSTNDTVLVLANGAAVSSQRSGVQQVPEIDEEMHPEAFSVFRQELTKFAVGLAKLVVYDGEGATKFITVTVKNAPTFEHAHHVASTVSTSSLVKCALYGEDANWGRILCAVGYSPLTTPTSISQSSPLTIDPTRVSVSFLPADGSSPLHVLINGEPEIVDESRASEVVGMDHIEIEIDLGLSGGQSAQYWTCDLSHEYVTINGDYRS